MLFPNIYIEITTIKSTYERNRDTLLPETNDFYFQCMYAYDVERVEPFCWLMVEQQPIYLPMVDRKYEEYSEVAAAVGNWNG